MKPPAKKAGETKAEESDITEKSKIKIFGPQINKWGKSILVIVPDVDKAFVPEENLIIKEFELYDAKELDGEEMELGEAVKDISKIKWRGLDDQKVGNKNAVSVDMTATNEILSSILEMAESCQKALTSMVLASKRKDKK